jgi:hypothetical protein
VKTRGRRKQTDRRRHFDGYAGYSWRRLASLIFLHSCHPSLPSSSPLPPNASSNSAAITPRPCPSIALQSAEIALHFPPRSGPRPTRDETGSFRGISAIFAQIEAAEGVR